MLQNIDFLLKKIGIILTIVALLVNYGTNITIKEQYPTHEYIPDDNGRGGDCRESGKQSLLRDYLQPDDIATGKYDDLMDSPDRPDHICTRTCKENEPPKICYYAFVVERFATMGLNCKDCPENPQDCGRSQCVPADGYEKMIITVNRRMPGPSIQVCEKDLIVVDVKNKMPGTSITVHWHGITQHGTPYMDGVPMVTQCPIMEAQTFRYYFHPNNPGLFFWHSHSGLQKVDGFVGSLVIRRPVEQDPHGGIYDYDLPSHVIVIQDWLHETADGLFPGLRKRRVGQHPDTFLINGKGVYLQDGKPYENTPYATFKVKTGFSYIFRIIGATCLSCPVRFQIENHELIIIGTDGRDTKPKVVNSIIMHAGERFKVIVRGKQLSQLKKQNYWIQVMASGICLEKKVIPIQRALLRYTDSPVQQRPTRPVEEKPGLALGEANVACNRNFGYCYMDLVGTEEAPIGIKKPKPDYRLIMGIDFYNFNNNTDEAFSDERYITTFNPVGDMPLVGHINGITMKCSPVPLLTQLNDVPKCLYCSTEQPYTEWHKVHNCLHLFRVLSYPSTVEVVVADIGTRGNKRKEMSHPMHLHGYDQYLIAEGIFETNDAEKELESLIEKLDDNHNIPDKPLLKDTYMIPSGGYIIYRIVADNPGFWIFHCHIAYHAETGMVAVVKIGNTNDHPKAPDGFPQCNSFLPKPNRN